jgi:hypothetical protein
LVGNQPEASNEGLAELSLLVALQNFSGLSSAYNKYTSSISERIPLKIYSRVIALSFYTLSQNRTYQKHKAKKMTTNPM